MATLNKVMLIGRLTDNPGEPRTMPSGGRVIPFRFAVGRSRKNPQTGQWENDPNPLYIDCEAFSRPDDRRRLTDIIGQYCQKGSQVYIEGRLQLDTWDDKNNPGQKRSKHKVVVEDVQFLDTRPGGGAGGMGGGMGSMGGGDVDGGMDAAPPARGFPPARGPAPRQNNGSRSAPPPQHDDHHDDGESQGDIPF